MSIDDRVQAMPLFRGLRPDALRTLTAGALLRRCAPGEVLWTAGARPRGLFVVLEGRVRVVRAPRGRQYTLHTEGPGGTLGEVPLFAGGRYPATAIAAEATTCLVLGRETLARTMALDPEFAFRLLARLAERVRTVVHRLDRRTGQTVTSRMGEFLLSRREITGANPFRLGATHSEVAEELGTVREVLVRALRTMREQGLIASAGRGRYAIPDPGALRAWCRRGA